MKKKNKFPIEAFTKVVHDHVLMQSEYNKINPNVVASAVLNSCGYILSNFYEVEIKTGWREKSNLWSIIALSSGMGKSVIMRHVFKDAYEKQGELVKRYKSEDDVIREWKGMIKGKKSVNIEEEPELRNWLHSKGLTNPPNKAKEFVMFSDDFTFEKLLKILDDNDGRAFMIRADEIMGLFNSFNRYRAGNDEETLLKLWGYDALMRNRINEEGNNYVSKPLVSLFGATQIEMLFDMYSQHRIINGNIFRILFCLDDEIKTKNVFEETIKYVNSLEEFNKKYLSMYENPVNHQLLPLDDDCMSFLNSWRNDSDKKYTSDGKLKIGTYNNIMGKMDSYIFRIAIILNRLDNFYGVQSSSIRVTDLVNSAKIIDFYVKEVINVLELTSLNYRKHLNGETEINFFENILPQSGPYFDVIKSMEHYLKYSQKDCHRLLASWIEKGILRRNAKGMVYKKS